jgi:hypothetical protein
MKYLKRLLVTPFILGLFLLARFISCFEAIWIFLKNGGDYNVNRIDKENILLHELDDFIKINYETVQLLDSWGYYFSEYSRPSLYKLADWLRIKFQIHVIVEYWEADSKYYFHSYEDSYESEAEFNTFEEALQAGIIHVLKTINLTR